MKMTRSLLLWAGILISVAVASSFGIEAMGGEEEAAPDGQVRADVILIDTLAAFGKLEEWPVEFHHDKHTEALEPMNKDCTACHLKDPEREDRLSLLYMRLDESTPGEIKDIYHSGCIGCHQEMVDAGRETGPTDVSCRGCHAKQPKVGSSWVSIGFDRNLHARHVAAKETQDREKNCGSCHHQYDEELEKLIYVKNEEGTCRYCHKEQTEQEETGQERISFRLAAHMDCVACHRDARTEGKDTGPITCGGCHTMASQQTFEKLDEVPRMDRGQPNTLFVQTGLEDAGDEQGQDLRMAPVPFDHKAHEEYNDTCRVCHHESMASCSAKCHTLAGAEEGGFVLLERAMHQEDSEQSCIGCHKTRQQDKSCAGCHAFIGQKEQSDAACVQCHMEPSFASQAHEGIVRTEGGHNATMAAAILLQEREAVTTTYADEDVPEKVTIKVLADEYEPSEFPHRKIVNKLVENIKDDKLASYFHPDQGTVCQGCHHNSPVSKKPPKCASCHGKPFDSRNPLRPGLKAAYHGQCMGCHTQMALEKPANTACGECHKEKSK